MAEETRMWMALRARKQVAWCCALLLLLMAATSCASSAPTGTTAVATATGTLQQATATTTVNPKSPTPPSSAKTVIVTIVLDSSTDILRFSPNTLTIHVGDSVKWVNDTTAPHTSSSDPGDPASWDGTMMKWHDTYTVRFTAAGTYTYSCAIHPNMMGTVIVTG